MDYYCTYCRAYVITPTWDGNNLICPGCHNNTIVEATDADKYKPTLSSDESPYP